MSGRYPAIAPYTDRPAINLGGAYGSPFAPLTTPAPVNETGTIQHAGALTAEAEAWVEHATAAGLPETVVLRKALDAVGFSIRKRARALAIPSKLKGVAKHQDTVARLAEHADGMKRGGMGLRLHVEDTGDQLTVGVRFEQGGAGAAPGPIHPLGIVQPKHVAWLAPLLATGATVCLSAVTGRQKGRTMGVNVLFGFVGLAIQARHFQADPGQPTPSDDDVILRRTATGDAEVIFERGGQPVADTYEWGYTGQGPSCLALAILRRFVSEDDAQRLAYDFIHGVIANIPRAGVRIEAGYIRRFIANHSTN